MTVALLRRSLAKLTGAEATVPIGKKTLYRIALDSPENGTASYRVDIFNGTARTVWLYRGQELEDEMVVEATLQGFHHPATVSGRDGDHAFEAFTEYKLLRVVLR